MTEADARTKASAQRTRRARRLRHAVRILAVIFALAALLAAVAPSILTSRRAQRWIAQTASRALDRPVEIEGIEFGWRTPLRVARIALPAVAGEADRPMLVLEGLSVPLTLGRIARLPPYSLHVGIARVEVNAVRSPDGTINFARLAARGGKGAATKPATPAKPAARKRRAAKPIAIPLTDLNFKLGRLDARFVDTTTNLVAGIEACSVVVDWVGGTNPLTAAAGWNIRLNDTSFPWRLSARMDSWVDAAGGFAVTSAVLSADAGPASGNLFSLRATTAGGKDSVVDLCLPLATLVEATRSLPAASALPALEGELGLVLRARHDGTFMNWDLRAKLDARDIAAGIAGAPAASPPRSAVAVAFTGTVSLAASVAAPSAAGDGVAAMPLRVKGELVTQIDTIEAFVNAMGIKLGDFSDKRSFTVALDPGNPKGLSYKDTARTALGSIEGSMGLVVGAFSMEARADVSGMENIGYEITRGEVSEVLFESKALALAVPPVTFSGVVAANLPKCDIAARNLALDLGGFASAGCKAVDFNWTNGAVAVREAGLALGGFSNLLAMVSLRDPAAAAKVPLLPSGNLQVTADLAGRIPTNFALGDPLPIAGEVVARLNGLAVDGGKKYQVAGLSVTSRLALAAGGEAMEIAVAVGVDRAGIPYIPAAVVKDLHLGATVMVRSFDQLVAVLDHLSIGNLGTTASARLAVEGLRDCLPPKAGKLTPAALFRTLRAELSATAGQDLGALAGIVTNLDCGGNVGVSFSLRSEPRRLLAGTFGLNARNVRMSLGDIVKVAGINGGFLFSKTLRPAGEGRRPVSPPAGRMEIASISVPAGRGLPAEIRGVGIELGGIEDGIRGGATVADLVGGTTEAGWWLLLRDGGPEVGGKVIITGLNAGALMPDVKFDDPSEADINGVADFAWSLPEAPRGTVLDHLRLRLRTMRIGKRALARLLQAMDSKQETPQFQSAIAALSLGTPTAVDVVLENSLLSMNAELRLASGVKVPLPVLDSAPLSDILGVYRLEGTETMLVRLRWGLLMLLAEDLDGLEKLVADMPR